MEGERRNKKTAIRGNNSRASLVAALTSANDSAGERISTHASDALILFCHAPLIGSPTARRSFTVNEAQGAGKQKKIVDIGGGDGSANPTVVLIPVLPLLVIPCTGNVSKGRIYGRERYGSAGVTGFLQSRTFCFQNFLEIYHVTVISVTPFAFGEGKRKRGFYLIILILPASNHSAS